MEIPNLKLLIKMALEHHNSNKQFSTQDHKIQFNHEI